MKGDDLTRRERQAFLFMALGYTDKEIGQALGISDRTAGIYTMAVLRKLGFDRRNQILPTLVGEHVVRDLCARHLAGAAE